MHVHAPHCAGPGLHRPLAGKHRAPLDALEPTRKFRHLPFVLPLRTRPLAESGSGPVGKAADQLDTRALPAAPCGPLRARKGEGAGAARLGMRPGSTAQTRRLPTALPVDSCRSAKHWPRCTGQRPASPSNIGRGGQPSGAGLAPRGPGDRPRCAPTLAIVSRRLPSVRPASVPTSFDVCPTSAQRLSGVRPTSVQRFSGVPRPPPDLRQTSARPLPDLCQTSARPPPDLCPTSPQRCPRARARRPSGARRLGAQLAPRRHARRRLPWRGGLLPPARDPVATRTCAIGVGACPSTARLRACARAHTHTGGGPARTSACDGRASVAIVDRSVVCTSHERYSRVRAHLAGRPAGCSRDPAGAGARVCANAYPLPGRPAREPTPGRTRSPHPRGCCVARPGAVVGSGLSPAGPGRRWPGAHWEI